MSTLVEKFPDAINSRRLMRGAGLFLTGAMLVGSLIDCDGEGPQLPTSQGTESSVERVVSGESVSSHPSLGGSALGETVQSGPIQAAAPEQIVHG